MQIEPIRHSVTAPIAAVSAFELSTGNMQSVRPCETAGKKSHVAIVLEPSADGRWYQVDDDKSQTNWGEVLERHSPHQHLLGWQLDSDFACHPALTTEVEISYRARADGATRIFLEDRRLERIEARVSVTRGRLDASWPGVLAGFAEMLAADGKCEVAHG